MDSREIVEFILLLGVFLINICAIIVASIMALIIASIILLALGSSIDYIMEVLVL